MSGADAEALVLLGGAGVGVLGGLLCAIAGVWEAACQLRDGPLDPPQRRGPLAGALDGFREGPTSLVLLALVLAGCATSAWLVVDPRVAAVLALLAAGYYAAVIFVSFHAGVVGLALLGALLSPRMLGDPVTWCAALGAAAVLMGAC